MYPDTNFYNGQTYFIGSDGRKIPLRVESVDFDIRYIGPKITGCLLYDSSYPDSKKSDSLIKKVIFNDPATIVIWSDNSKTVVKCQEGDTYDAEKGLALCIAKKYLGNKGNFNEVFKKWIPEETDNSYVGECETCKYVEKGLYDKPCLDCNHNDGNKNNYKEA